MPRRKATCLRRSPLTWGRGSFEENLPLGNLHQIWLLGMRSVSVQANRSPGFLRSSEDLVGGGPWTGRGGPEASC